MLLAAQSVARAKLSAPLGGHLWHVVGAVAFIVVSLGGIWLSEVWQRRRQIAGASAPSGASLLTHPGGASGSSLVGVAGLSAPRRLHGGTVLLPLVALGSAAAASVHFVVMPTHFKEAAIYGSFFAVAASLQVAYAVLVLARPSRALLVVGLVGNLLVIVLWLVTRTVAIPLGPAAGTTEAVGGLDILATAFESLIVVSAASLLCRGKQERLTAALRPGTWAPAVWLSAAGAAAAVAVVTVIAPPS